MLAHGTLGVDRNEGEDVVPAPEIEMLLPWLLAPRVAEPHHSLWHFLNSVARLLTCLIVRVSA